MSVPGCRRSFALAVTLQACLGFGFCVEVSRVDASGGAVALGERQPFCVEEKSGMLAFVVVFFSRTCVCVRNVDGNRPMSYVGYGCVVYVLVCESKCYSNSEFLCLLTNVLTIALLFVHADAYCVLFEYPFHAIDFFTLLGCAVSRVKAE